MIRYQDLPERLNLASVFVDANLTEDRGGGGRTALITEDGPVSYAELAREVNRVGSVLRELGVSPGRRVLIALNDGLEFVATWYAAQKIGAVTAEVYTFLPAKDYAYYAGYTDAAVIVADADTLDRMREAADGRTLLVVGADPATLRPGEHPYETLVAAAPHELTAAPTRRDDLAIWKFTTGSTGAPKACSHPVASPVLSHHAYAVDVLGIRPDDVVLPVPKLFFGYARDLTALFPFGVGAAGITFSRRSTADVMFELIARHRPTILVNVPTMMSAMVTHPDAAEQDLSCLRLCTSAGEALPEQLHRDWLDTFGVEVIDGIGSSEAYHIYISHSPGSARPGSLGRLVPGYTARVLDPDGQPVAAGVIGTLEITGPTVAREYVGDAATSAATFGSTDGWDRSVRSSDLFRIDADGWFHYAGRADDLIKVGGIWVAPGEIESCLLAHPAVAACAVVGHDVDGLTRVRAFVVAAPCTAPTADELRVHVRSRLSGHKCPDEFVPLAELPRTSNGKLDRRALRETP